MFSFSAPGFFLPSTGFAWERRDAEAKLRGRQVSGQALSVFLLRFHPFRHPVRSGPDPSGLHLIPHPPIAPSPSPPFACPNVTFFFQRERRGEKKKGSGGLFKEVVPRREGEDLF